MHGRLFFFAVANCHVGSRSAPLAAGARLIAAPTLRRRRHLARRETALHRRQNKREVAARPRQQKHRRSLLLLFSSCRRRTRARSASLREDTTTGIRTGSIRAPARTPADRATESCRSCTLCKTGSWIYDWFCPRARGHCGGGRRRRRRLQQHTGGRRRADGGGGARTAAATRRRCSSAADDDNDAAPAAPPARQLPARSVLSLHLHTGRVIGAARSALSC